jgi:hypothetical protein
MEDSLRISAQNYRDRKPSAAKKRKAGGTSNTQAFSPTVALPFSALNMQTIVGSLLWVK